MKTADDLVPLCDRKPNVVNSFCVIAAIYEDKYIA